MASDWRTVEPDGVVRLNAQLVALTGEPHLLVSRPLLESACARPLQHAAYGETDGAMLAAELLFGLARNHPFAQGNKRTAFAAMLAFLRLNEHVFLGGDDLSFADAIIAVLEGRETETAFADRLRPMIPPAREAG